MNQETNTTPASTVLPEKKAIAQSTLNAKPKAQQPIVSMFKKINKLFVLVVLVPVLASLVYFSFVASDVYVSESSFVIRSPRSQGALTGLGAILQGAGFSRSQDDTYTVHEYMKSRDALTALSQTVDLQKHYSSTDVNMFSRLNFLGLQEGAEGFYQYFQDKIVIGLDHASSISTLQTKAYSPEVAQQINESLLNEGELIINQLNNRARADLIAFAEKEVESAKQNVKSVADSLNTFRVKNGVFDLKAQTNVQLQLVSKLQDELINIKMQLAQVKAVTPNNPQIPSLQAREKSIRSEIASELAKISGVGNASFSNKAAEYEKLSLENKFAEQQFSAALASLESAKNEADKKQLYLEHIAKPNKPDMAAEPRRIRNILATLVISLILYGILSLLVTSVREHQD